MTSIKIRRKLNRLPNGSTVSFDVFDTLIMRKNDPADSINATVYYAMRIMGIPRIEINFDKVLAARVKAWQTLISNRKRAKEIPCEDAEIHEMYPIWFTFLSIEFPEADVNSQLTEMISEFEFSLEKWSLEPISEMKDLLFSLRHKKFRFIFISDMYFSKNQIFTILNKCGFEDVFAEGYVSGELGVLKRTGNLFKFVVNQGEIISLHIGDNTLADFESPRNYGIPSICFVHKSVKIARRKIRLRRLLLKNLPKSAPYLMQTFAEEKARRQGVKVNYESSLASLIALYVGEMNCYSKSTTYFASRDGLLFHSLIASNKFQHSYFDSAYLPISREVLVGTLYKDSFTDFLREIEKSDHRSTYLDVFRKLGFSDKRAREIFEGIGENSILSKINSSQNLFLMRQLIREPEIGQAWENYCQVGDYQLKEYLNLNPAKEQTLNFFDLGWNGTTQDGLSLASGTGLRIQGIYFGLRKNTSPTSSKNVKQGILNASAGDIYSSYVISIPQLTENIFSAPHDSLRKCPKDLASLEWTVTFSPADEIDVRAEIAKSAHDFYKHLYFSYWLFTPGRLEIGQFISATSAKIHIFPSPRMARKISSLESSSGLGLNSSYSLISHATETIQGYSNSLWKPGWLSIHTKSLLKYVLTLRSVAKTGIIKNVETQELQSASPFYGSEFIQSRNNSQFQLNILESYKKYFERSEDIEDTPILLRDLFALRILLTNLNAIQIFFSRKKYKNFSIPTRTYLILWLLDKYVKP
jgi:FMN phosphatase YigB (HAD superfamily)